MTSPLKEWIRHDASPKEMPCPDGHISPKQNRNACDLCSRSRPSFHTFASDSCPRITRSREPSVGHDPNASVQSRHETGSRNICTVGRLEMPRRQPMNRLFSQTSSAVAYQTGRSTTFIAALLLVLIW